MVIRARDSVCGRAGLGLGLLASAAPGHAHRAGGRADCPHEPTDIRRPAAHRAGPAGSTSTASTYKDASATPICRPVSSRSRRRFGMQVEAPEAFDLAKESDATLKMYGLERGSTDGFAWQCIVARRLVERGVRFVELIDGGTSIDKNWDTHAKMANYNGMAKNVDPAHWCIDPGSEVPWHVGRYARGLDDGVRAHADLPVAGGQKGAGTTLGSTARGWPVAESRVAWSMGRVTRWAMTSPRIPSRCMTSRQPSWTALAWITSGLPTAMPDATSGSPMSMAMWSRDILT